MTLNNDQRDVIGYLRAINVMLLVWNNSPIATFPLDVEMDKLLQKHRPELERLLHLVCQISRMTSESHYSEARSAVDDLLSPEGRFYDQETLDLLLVLYSGKRNKITFTYHDAMMFYQETKPIFRRLLFNLTGAMLWARVGFYAEHLEITLSPLVDLLLQALTIIFSIAPSQVALRVPEQLLEDCISWWISSGSVQKGLALTRGETNGLTRVVDELKRALSI
jgi:hypothetical protein